MGKRVFTDESLNALVDEIKTSDNNLQTQINNNYSNIAYATCSTAADVAAKVVTITSDPDWELTVGSVVTVKFSYTNSVANPMLNVNGTGAKPIYYNTAVYTSTGGYGGTANRHITYQYDGTNWVFISWSYDQSTNTQVRVYRQDASGYNKDYPLIASKTVAASLGTVGTESSYEGVYGLISDTDANIPTTNPYTGLVKVKTLTASDAITATGGFTGDLTGNASTATTATKVGTTDVGSATNPVYIKAGVPTKTTYTLEASVPSGAKFTDTTYSIATSSIAGLIKSGTDITVDSEGNVSVNDDSHNHTIANIDNLQSSLDGKINNTGTNIITTDESNPFSLLYNSDSGSMTFSPGTSLENGSPGIWLFGRNNSFNGGQGYFQVYNPETQAYHALGIDANGDAFITGKLIMRNNPIEVQYGGTGATTIAGILSNLGIKTATASLAKASWSSNTLTISNSSITASNIIIVAPSPESYVEWGACKVRATTQSAGKLTFECDETPTIDITANLVFIGV